MTTADDRNVPLSSRPMSSVGACLLRTAVLAVALASTAFGAQRPSYPPAPTSDVVDDYHGVKVADTYRPLEDADAPSTTTWVDAENALTRSYLDAVPGREELRARLTALYNYPRSSVPERRGPYYFVTRNTGLQNQSVLYVQTDPAGALRLLLDPNTLAADGTVALTAFNASEDGALLAYALSEKGSDRQEIHVLDVASGKDLPDRLEWVKFTGFAWTPNHAGFYYMRFPKTGTVPAGDENYYGAVYYHRIGDPQSADAKIYDYPSRKEAFPQASITRDGRWLLITTELGASDESEVRVVDRTAAGDTGTVLFPGFTSSYNFIDEKDGVFYFLTNANAPRRKIITVDYAHGQRTTNDAVAESPDLTTDAVIAGDVLVVGRLHNASSQLVAYTLGSGAAQREGTVVPLPALGSLGGLTGRPTDSNVFYSFASFVQPPTVYRWDSAHGTSSVYFAPPASLQAADYETRQVWYPSKDGTKVSMFIVSKKGLKLDGARPTFLTGYGGFNVPMTPYYGAWLFTWLDRGGVYALPNLRGGSEYGEEWHKAGMLEKKQNVFDDLIAAGEWLVAHKYTRPSRLAIAGGSNGGLLVGACEVERPDLFGAVVCQVPVADMLRYHLFTVGRFWIPEYGSADDPQQFAFLYKYSPLHNVKDGVAYPATIVMTADHDDRVSPGLAKKFAARLQAASGGEAPILIRVETKAGHGGGKPITKRIDEDVDMLSFLFRSLGVVPNGKSS